MKLLLGAVLIAIYLGYLFGGRLDRIESLRPRWWGLIVAGLGVQFVPLPEGAVGTDLLVRTAVLTLSYTLLVAFAAINIRMPGMVLVLIGLACNFAVVAINGGMPVSAEALRDSGQEEILELLRTEGSDKHHLLTEGDDLTFLADVIAVRQPIGQAISVGDLFIYGGLVWLVVAAMRAPFRRSASSAERKPTRGKHRRGASQEPPTPPDLGFHPAGATRSGSGR
ncbi:MAG: DUF5317 domain-containing protein [Actinobacteria bacterium]|nr:DUF5317 domain-containing protein [Actinomycetota bacterium]